MKKFYKKIALFASILTLLTASAVLVWWRKSITVTGNQPAGPTSQLTGQPCENNRQRPIAVMLASDPVDRPLSGISKADVVFEMPVTPDGVTRMMAVFQCQQPGTIGSVRSARQDFIPLAAGIGAIYAHWGGERDAENQLRAGIMDNIDGLLYDGTVFYRKAGLRAPHNGFTTWENLVEKAKDLGYALTSIDAGYPHTAQESARNISNIADTVAIDYPAPYNITWKYSPGTKTYARWRDMSPETDALDGQAVQAGVVAVLNTQAKPIGDQYLSVTVTGQGNATIYQYGTATAAFWKKSANHASQLMFTDINGKVISFAPGMIWIEIVAN
jgi:hypothetical protein